MIGKLFTKTAATCNARCSELIANALSDITLATLSNNLKSVGFHFLSK
jgi:hypothetical protein